ncbi:MAG: DNA replication/repair protein RecF [Spirochaetaceae bacterium]|nr:MAG: DNA replication/repair protein RecF [Spirochaetaceae bacterium]
MGFTRLRTYQFRNLGDGETDLSAPRVFLVGRNGQGKSNLLEALYLLSYGGSFRTHRDQELSRIGTDAMALEGSFEAPHGSYAVDIRFQEGRKTIRLDGNLLQDRRDMVSLIPSVVFRHDDMAFVDGPPEMQRWFVDQTLSMDQPLYIDDMRRYRRILRNRNQVIRDRQYDMLPVYDQQLAEQGLQLQRRRREVLSAFNEVFAREFSEIARLPRGLAVEYRPSWREMDSVPEVTAHLEKHRAREEALRTTTSGPHRDRILFRYGDTPGESVDFLTMASTGQVRLVALILRVAQARFYTARTGRRPVLLLDDVLLELDQERRERFVSRLPESDQQVFTFLPEEPYHGYRREDTLVYSVVDGILQRQ